VIEYFRNGNSQDFRGRERRRLYWLDRDFHNKSGMTKSAFGWVIVLDPDPVMHFVPRTKLFFYMDGTGDIEDRYQDDNFPIYHGELDEAAVPNVTLSFVDRMVFEKMYQRALVVQEMLEREQGSENYGPAEVVL
jgi:hypothetical protein